MDYKKYFENQNTEKQIKKLTRKYKNKKVVLYGAGMYSQALLENYDLSGLNIVAIADRSFVTEENKEFFGFKAINTNELKTLDYDVILLCVYDVIKVWDFLRDELLPNTKNANVKIQPAVYETLISIFKEYFNSRNSK